MSFADRLARARRPPSATSQVEEPRGLAARMGLTTRGPSSWHPSSRPRRPVVQDSPDLRRILALPERILDLSKVPAWPREQELRKENPDCKCREMGRHCVTALNPLQRAVCIEAEQGLSLGTGTVFAAAGVGHGKELLCELLPLVMRAQNALLLIPPSDRETFPFNWAHYGQHWLQPNLVGGSGPFVLTPGWTRLTVVAYSELSHKKFTAMLKAIAPDLVIANEAHKLSNLDSVGTSRIVEYLKDNPRVPFIPLTGTPTKDGLENYGHLSALALGEGSPLPIDPEVLAEWAAAIDPERKGGKLPALKGALSAMCRPGEDVRAAFKRRRATTRGMIDTTEASVAATLHIHQRVPPPSPSAVREAIAFVRRTGIRPDGHEWDPETAAGEIAACLRQLAAGFYYRWIYPRGEPEPLIKRWFAARRAWNAEVREMLLRRAPHMDSPALLMEAAARAFHGRTGTLERPVWSSRAFAEWREVRKQVVPEQQAVWIDDWLARDAAGWGKEHKGIIWYTSRAFGLKVAEISKLPRFGDGKMASATIERERGDRSIVASIHAHGQGKNLQYAFCKMLFGQMPADVGLFEQYLGRCHRQGQPKDTVDAWFYLHDHTFREDFAVGRERALYVAGTTPSKAKLVHGDYHFSLEGL
jgi:hypothetical protein